ncbi:hypothetical protein FJT64_002423 [Amphibalanus amphitrite]|uniref:Uncharacterized protein n=1 Tax=Amphibalanus amphitrite TaxID=1232801 RepID=A0A6A4WG43_AMPAM|nr:hypothetical protein FJT64_002423 [Amphibalanus amphitrite]
MHGAPRGRGCQELCEALTSLRTTDPAELRRIETENQAPPPHIRRSRPIPIYWDDGGGLRGRGGAGAGGRGRGRGRGRGGGQGGGDQGGGGGGGSGGGGGGGGSGGGGHQPYREAAGDFPPLSPRPARAVVEVVHVASGGGTGGAAAEDCRQILSAFLRRQLGPSTASELPAPEVVVVSLGSNALTPRATPHSVHGDAPAIAAAVAGNIRWLLGSLLMFGAPEATVVLMTVVPRAQLSDADLSVFRQLSDALRDVAADFGPRCVLLDVERLLNAESSAPDSWRRRVSFHGLLGGAVVRAVEEGSGDAWSLSPLPQDFPRLGVKDFCADGVHLHGLNYRTIRAAVEETAMAAAAPQPQPGGAAESQPPAQELVLHRRDTPLWAGGACRCCGSVRDLRSRLSRV